VVGIALVSLYVLARGSEVSLLVVSANPPVMQGGVEVDWVKKPEEADMRSYTLVIAPPEMLDAVLGKADRVMVLPAEVIERGDYLRYLGYHAPFPRFLPQLAIFAGILLLSTIGGGRHRLAGALLSVSLVLYLTLSLVLTLTGTVSRWMGVAQEALLITAVASGLVMALQARAQHKSL